MLAAFVPGNIMRSNALVTEADIKAIEDKIKNNETKIAEYERNIAALKNSTATATRLKNELDEQIKTMQDTIDDTALLIEQYESMIEQKSEMITKREGELGERYRVLLDYLRVTYEDGSRNYLELILSSESLTDFLIRVERMANLVESQQQLMQDVDNEIRELEEAKETLQDEKKKTEELKAQQIETEYKLQLKLEEAINLIKEYQTNTNTAIKALNEAKKLDQELDAEIQKKLEELEAQKNAYVGGKFIWPVEITYRRLSSYYGWRDLDGDGKKEDFHLGIDIPANYGSNVYAVNSGTVVTATYHRSYGYYVLIDHGGGIATLYAHNSKLCVSAGQKVKQGDVIAKIGTTGTSTGYHCHFEVRENGKTVDPLANGYVVQPKG